MHPLIYIDLPYLVVGRYLSINSAETHCKQQCFKNCSKTQINKCVTNHFLPYIRFRNDYLSLKILTKL